jgi:hypothetical protein
MYIAHAMGLLLLWLHPSTMIPALFLNIYQARANTHNQVMEYLKQREIEPVTSGEL